MKYQLLKQQQFYCDIVTVWNFFSSPFNLTKITPDNMRFDVISNLKDESIYEGMEIEYIVSPLLRIPLKWKTRITQVDKFKSFTDMQEKGPYKYWNHNHQFVLNSKGVLMQDRVDYELPFGFLGGIAHQLLVKKKLESIFDYRYQVLEKTFNQEKFSKQTI